MHASNIQLLKQLGIIDWQPRHETSLQEDRLSVDAQTKNQHATLMIISDSLTTDEDPQPKAFNEAADRLLNAMINSLGNQAQDVRISHLNSSTLQETANLAEPTVLLVLGELAAQDLLGDQSSLESLRSKRHTYGANKTPTIVTYHPEHLLQHPADKKKAFADLQLAQRTIKELNHGTTLFSTEKKL